jgi:hypothetical protein
MKHVTSVIDIPPSQERVWAALVDPASYPERNLFKLGVRGIFDGRHSFTLQSSDGYSTRLTQSEE